MSSKGKEPAYRISKEGNILKIGFGRPAQNDEICKDALKALQQLEKELEGGELIKINGPVSFPVAVLIGHFVAHKYAYVAIYDPILDKYVVAIAHGPKYAVGDLID